MEDWKPWKEGGCGGVADKVAPRRVQSAEARRRDGGWLGFLSVFAPSRLPTASVGRGPEFYAIECVRPFSTLTPTVLDVSVTAHLPAA